MSNYILNNSVYQIISMFYCLNIKIYIIIKLTIKYKSRSYHLINVDKRS